MKKLFLIMAIAIGLTIAFTFSGHSVKGPLLTEEPIDAGFEVLANGKIQDGDQVFNSMSDYFYSDHFRLNHRRCKPVIPEVIRDINTLVTVKGSPDDCSTSCTVIKAEYWPTGVYTIPIVFHILINTDGTGDLPDSRIINQVQVMNEDYRALAGTLGENGYDVKVQFELAGITRTVNKNWFNDRGERRYKTTLGWDQDRYLNVYTNTASGYLGYSYFPQTSAGEWQDGVVLNYQACGGRDEGSAPYDQGRTLVHEVGHYLGLFHTFQDGCATGYCAGDRIEDTNPEAEPFYYCGDNFSCDTPDPTTNYMDYSEDLCMWQFTAEQANRAICSLLNYRPLLYY